MTQESGASPFPPRLAFLVAASALVCGLLPGRGAAWATIAIAVGGSLVVFAAPRERRGRQALTWMLLGLTLASGLAAVPEILPRSTPADALARAAAGAETRWTLFLAELEDAVSPPPPAGGEFAWMIERRLALGPEAGLALYDARDPSPLAWSGWTSRLSADERALLPTPGSSESTTLVLRRGLALRLLVARAHGTDLVLAAERALPPEPDPGPLRPPAELGIEARVRWLATGEGLRAPFAGARPGDERSLWSLVPLMAQSGRVAAHISLGARDISEGAFLIETRRRALMALLAGLALVGVALARPAYALVALLAARLAALAASPALASYTSISFDAPWESLIPAALPALARGLLSTPFETLLSGVALVLLAGLQPLPQDPRLRRAWLVVAGVLALVFALAAGVVTRASGLGPLEPWIPGLWTPASLFAVLALASPAWAAALLAGRALGRGTSAPLVAIASLVALLAGLAHGEGVARAAAPVLERALVEEVRGRNELWARALEETLELAVPRPESGILAPQRDAIDLWWNSSLGRAGLASGVWRFAADGALEDSFASGLPPIVPEPEFVDPPAPAFEDESPSLPFLLENEPDLVDELEGPVGPMPFTRRFAGPRLETLRFVGGAFEIMLAEVERPEGGSWIAAVLASPGNVPSRAQRDRLRGARAAASPAAALPPSPGSRARLAWYDEAGRLLDSDLVDAPPPPLGPLRESRQRRAQVEGREALVLDVPDTESRGTVVAVVFLPGPLQRASIALGWAALVGFLTGLLTLLRAWISAPARSWQALLRGVFIMANGLRMQAGVALVVAGMIPLIALGVMSRGVAQRNAAQRLVEQAAGETRNARRFIEDYLALDAESGARLDDGVAAWLSRTIGGDVFAWSGGDLLATSRPDLVRAGLWPERVWGEQWAAIVQAREPLRVEEHDAPTGSSLPAVGPVAHAPFLESDDVSGMLSVPVGRLGTLVRADIAAFDRALIVGAVLLLGLAALLVTPTTGRLVRPLSELEKATSGLAEGRFDTPIPETGFEETRVLARAFRTMADSLAGQRLSLERRRAAMEALIASMPVAVVAQDVDEKVWAANPPAMALLGVKADAAWPHSDDPLVTTCRALLGETGDAERTVAIADERRRHYRVLARDLPGSREGEPRRVAIIEDLTDAMRSERLLAWAGMARRIAHEIKNPLTPISLVVDHIRAMAEKGDPRLADSLPRTLDTIADQVSVLRDTAREFSDYARLLVARPEPVQLEAELRRWVAPYEIAPPEGVRIEIESQEDLPAVRVDTRLLRRAVVNLLDNALAAVREGGRISVRWRVLEGSPRRVRIEVEDNGAGVPPERVADLFEPDVTTREGGSGLGLPIARQAVEAHGGSLELDGSYEEGARFVIVLPLSS